MALSNSLVVNLKLSSAAICDKSIEIQRGSQFLQPDKVVESSAGVFGEMEEHVIAPQDMFQPPKSLLMKLKLPKGVTYDREKGIQRLSATDPPDITASGTMGVYKQPQPQAEGSERGTGSRLSLLMKLNFSTGVTYDKNHGIQRSSTSLRQSNTFDAMSGNPGLDKSPSIVPHIKPQLPGSFIPKLKLPNGVTYDKEKEMLRFQTMSSYQQDADVLKELHQCDMNATELKAKTGIQPVLAANYDDCHVAKYASLEQPDGRYIMTPRYEHELRPSLMVKLKLPLGVIYDKDKGIQRATAAAPPASPVQFSSGVIEQQRNQTIISQPTVEPQNSSITKLKLPTGVTYDKENGIQRLQATDITKQDGYCDEASLQCEMNATGLTPQTGTHRAAVTAKPEDCHVAK